MPIVGTLGLANVVNNILVELSADDQIYVFYTQENKEFNAKFKAVYGVFPGTYADNAYDGLILLVEAVSQANGRGQSISDYLKTKTNYHGYAKIYRFDQNGDVKGGEWLLEKIK